MCSEEVGRDSVSFTRVAMEMLVLASVLTLHLHSAKPWLFLACVDFQALWGDANIQLSTYMPQVGGGEDENTQSFLQDNCSQQVCSIDKTEHVQIQIPLMAKANANKSVGPFFPQTSKHKHRLLDISSATSRLLLWTCQRLQAWELHAH